MDRVISDFLAGAAERLIEDADVESDVLVVEGQGSLWHPAYAGVTLGLLHGSAPHVLVLCHQAGRDAIEEPPYTRLPPLPEMIRFYEASAATVRPARVAAIAVNCTGFEGAAREQVLSDIEHETGLATADPLNGGAAKLWAAIDDALSHSR